jgi:hypothetical protein
MRKRRPDPHLGPRFRVRIAGCFQQLPNAPHGSARWLLLLSAGGPAPLRAPPSCRHRSALLFLRASPHLAPGSKTEKGKLLCLEEGGGRALEEGKGAGGGPLLDRGDGPEEGGGRVGGSARWHSSLPVARLLLHASVAQLLLLRRLSSSPSSVFLLLRAPVAWLHSSAD